MAHFSMAPKIEILPKSVEHPEILFVKRGEIKATRGEYLDYLQRLTAFDTKYQKVQTNFAAHFELVRGVAFFHPENVHQYIDNIGQIQSNEKIRRFAVMSWFQLQAEMFARLLTLREAAERTKLADDPKIRPVLDLYAAGAKTALLEELIILGDMEPTVEGITRFVKDKPQGYRELLEKGVELDKEATPMEEQKRLKKRWSDFRRDVMSHTAQTRYDQDVISYDLPGDTPLAKVNEHKISLADYMAVYGKPSSDRLWRGINKAHVARLILFHAMADLTDRLEILPQRVERDIQLSSGIYLLGVQLARQAAPAVLDKNDFVLSLKDVRQIMQYPNVIEVKDWLLSQKQEESLVEKGFLRETDWSLKRVLAPKHSIHL